MVRFGLHEASSSIFGEGGIASPFYSVQDFNLFRGFRWTGKLKNDVGKRIRYYLSPHSFSSPLSDYPRVHCRRVKKRYSTHTSQSLDWQNKNFARVSRFFVHSFPVSARLRRKNA